MPHHRREGVRPERFGKSVKRKAASTPISRIHPRFGEGKGGHAPPRIPGDGASWPSNRIIFILTPFGARINAGKSQNPAASDRLIRPIPGRRIVAHSGVCFSSLATTTVMSSAISPS